ncbi:hypothetical protein Cycma_4334 [Cyclobacterium marinum DSM 745]|uniref:Uncharacterized protein n=1 Tax=Cyclobacterium marinum (strain ATCC 25205 / DSM 745 / LMG 13164 / NCIMB 1802) TaxID=880070 RepID=G0IXN9_CYCMS|nr:hypothetical protein Cycma_4334 [Cyclobacterium marinum DSM 745]
MKVLFDSIFWFRWKMKETVSIFEFSLLNFVWFFFVLLNLKTLPIKLMKDFSPKIKLRKQFLVIF